MDSSQISLFLFWRHSAAVLQIWQCRSSGDWSPCRGGVDAESIERDVGFDRLRVGQSVFPVFHVRGAFLDAATDRLVPRITVSEVIVCCGGDDGTTSGEDLQEARTPT